MRQVDFASSTRAMLLNGTLAELVDWGLMMRFEGTLTAWNVLRGYGAMTPLDGEQELFVHIASFVENGVQPALGDAFSFEVTSGRDGRKEAVRVRRTQAQLRPAHKLLTPAPVRRRRAKHPLRALVLVALIASIGGLAWWEHSRPGGRHLAWFTAGAQVVR